MPDWLSDIKKILPNDAICTVPERTKSCLTDWRGHYQGDCALHVRPQTVEELSRLAKFCHSRHIALTPQGGNTGLCGGATPNPDGKGILVTFDRMASIRHIDSDNHHIIAEAGVILEELQRAVEKAGLFFPLSLASQGSCTIGGNLATNAGGVHVLRYGNCRDLTLGLEAVLADGTIIKALSPLRKDNSGYDIKNLLIGSEGTIGMITAASLRLFPAQPFSLMALIAIPSPSEALSFFNLIRKEPTLSAFELLPGELIEAGAQKIGRALPLSPRPEWAILVELTTGREDEGLRQWFEDITAQALTRSIINDAVFAFNEGQCRFFWQLREALVLAQKNIGFSFKHDIALPVTHIPLFITETNALIRKQFPSARPSPFGHMGDGNIHYNVFLEPEDGANAEQIRADLGRLVYDQVISLGGTISAEHGIGVLKRDILPLYKDEGSLAMMRQIKKALDPHNIMNPGKLL